MGDRAADFLGRARDIDVDPLMITGRVGKLVHAVLIDRVPVGHADFLPGKGFEICVGNFTGVGHRCPP